ncbi:MAG: DUF559 domain-containing protein, partial [Chitinophagaceae bacterium]
MNLSVLQGFYSDDTRLKQIAAALSLPNPKFRASLEGLRGSAAAFVATAVWQLSEGNHVFVLSDKEEAAYFHNDLEHLTGALDILYFPDSFKRSAFFSDLNSSHVMLRTEALSKFNGERVNKKILVTYPEALFEKVVNPASLSKNMIQIRVGENLKPEPLLAQFVELGFHREDFVYEPGQFAMRGGILDIYSFGNEHPYRIELFGNEVDSIRLFNPETQLSERKLLSVSILPNIETKFESGEKISLLDYLPANTSFWFKDFGFTFGKMEQMQADLPEKIEIGELDEDHEIQIQRELTAIDFEDVDVWLGKIKERHLLEWGGRSLEGYMDSFPSQFRGRPSPKAPHPGSAFARELALIPRGEGAFGTPNSEVDDVLSEPEVFYGYQTGKPEIYGKLLEFAKQNRQTPTSAEAKLWSALRGNSLSGNQFRRQHPIDQFIADFICLKKCLIIELDGGIHQLPDNKYSDEQRTTRLNELGFDVLRFSNDEVLMELPKILKKVDGILKSLPERKPLWLLEEGKMNLVQESNVNMPLLSQDAGTAGSFPLGGEAGRGVKKWSETNADLITIPFSTEEQPSFNRQFDLLKKDLKERSAKQFTPFVFAEQPKQLERLRSIFEDSQAAIDFVPIPTAISKGFIDNDHKVVCYTDHQIFQRYHKYSVKQAYSKGKAITLKALRDLQPGDFVSHIDHGVGRYSGLQKIDVNGNMQEAVRIIYKDNDVLYVNINSLHKISKFTGKDGSPPRINKLGSDAWEKLKNKTKKQVKDIAADLIKLYAKRKASKGFAHSPDTYLQTELEASFFYEDTPDQATATADVKRDMEAEAPMDRLVCGDVGFGKTEVAIRAAFKTVVDGKQAAILVPTTILAYQHFQTFSERLKDFPCTVDYINRFKSAKEKKETMKALAEGKVDIIIGTHGLLGKDVKFKDLGILVIDEEQKFGVSAKEKLRERKASVDTLTLTATPIPRTLQFSLMSARDLSIINTPPPNRQPVHTEVLTFDETTIRDALYFETERGGQVYFVHNRVQSLPDMMSKLRSLCPDLNFVMAHGQMEGHKLEKALADFISYKYDVLCCTNIVESGVDISNANTIIINNAHHYGLSDLH